MTSDAATALEIVIVGAGGFGREMRCLLPGFLPQGGYHFKGFLGEDQGTPSSEDVSRLILGDPMTYVPEVNDRFVLAIGQMPARRRTVEALRDKGATFLSLIHSQAIVAPTAQIGQGVIVFPFAAVSHNAFLDDCAKLNYYASVGHDTTLGKYCLLAPYATVNGFGTLEDDVYLSTHATVAPQVTVGTRSVVSANSAVMKSVPADSFVFGVPGRCMRRVNP